MSDTKLSHWCDIAARVLLVISAIAVLVMPFFYPVVGYDGWIHLNWLSQFPKLFSEGYLYPRWMPESFAGFGSPAFYFYPPLVYWISGVIYTCGLQSPVAIYQCLTFIFVVLSGLICYFFLRSFIDDKRAAFFGALLYCASPYRFADMYMRNALTEHAAFVFIPILLLSLVWVKNSSSSRSKIILASAAGWTGLIFTNIPAFIISVYGILIYIIASGMYRKEFRKNVVAFLFGSLLAFVVSACVILPAADLLKYISISTAIRDKGFIGQVTQTGYALVDMFSPQKINTLYILLGMIIFLGGLLLFSERRTLAAKSERDGNSRALGWILVAALAFQIPFLLQPLWRILPMMPVTQFTWRWDIWITIILAIFVAKKFAASSSRVLMNVIVITSCIVTIVFATTYYSKVHSKTIGFNPVAGVAMDAPEYLPRSVTMPPDSAFQLIVAHKNDKEIHISKGYANIRSIIRELNATTFSASVSSEQTELLFHRMYFPTWHLRDDRGVEYPIRSDSLGRITAVLPQGNRNYELKIIPTNNERVGGWLTIAGLLTFAGLGVFTVLSRKREASSS